MKVKSMNWVDPMDRESCSTKTDPDLLAPLPKDILLMASLFTQKVEPMKAISRRVVPMEKGSTKKKTELLKVNLKRDISLTAQSLTQMVRSTLVQCVKTRKKEKTVNFTTMTDKNFMAHSRTTTSSMEP